MTHTPAKSAAGAGIEARMQVGLDVGSADCASEALLRVQDWAPVRVWDLSAGCRWAVRPSSCQGSKDAGLLQDSVSVGGWSLGSDSFAWSQ
jgi:hypothetical protein